MKVKVRTLRKEGKLIPKVVADGMPQTVGVLEVREERDRMLARTILRARLLDATNRAERDLLPDLSDARLIWAQENRLRFTGFEAMKDTNYAQTWDVEIDSATVAASSGSSSASTPEAR